MIWMLRQAFGHKLPGMQFDTADEIFAGAAADYAKLGQGGGEPEGGQADNQNTEPDNQDVDQKGQGTPEGAPGTPDESAKETAEKAEQEQSPSDKKEKKDGVAEVRKWGEGWETTAKNHEKKIGEYEPVIKFVNEKFGGQANLELASELYAAVINKDDFNPETAIDFLSENLPEVAERLVEYISKSVAEKASETTMERTFGRKLNAQDIKDVQAFLAAGKKTEGRKVDTSFLKTGEIPEHLKFDSEGNERDPQILDYLWKQEQALHEANEKLQNLEGRVTGADKERQEEIASEAVSEYIANNFQGIGDKISELALDKPIEGETEDVTQLRNTCVSLIEAIVMHKASKDAEFQAMYRKGVESTIRSATNAKDRAAKANSTDYSRRIKARIDEMAADAASMISVLTDSLASKRATQVEKVKKATTVSDSAGGHQTSPKEADPNRDPFDSEDIWNEVNDKLRAGRGGR